ncbi:hypothetical protein CPB97_002470 [Podila verticillata]|nr:hypothetical protein CPB97_002470 [Podila verticillata]
MVRLLTGLAGLATLVSAVFADIQFNVVGYPTSPTNIFGVNIGGSITKLTTTETTFPLWSGPVPGSTSSAQYSYVELSANGTVVQTESFTRGLNSTDTKTDNEFFQRATTRWVLPHIPYTYLFTWPSDSKAFKDDEIATIHVTADAAQIANLEANPQQLVDIRCTFRFINHDTLYTQTNISFTNSGKSSKDFQKQAYKFSFDTNYNQSFFSRPNIKLRSEVTDPTMMREKLYIDMLNSVGVPTQQGAWVRLFVNNQPYGLYLMVDDIKKSFVKQTIYSGDANAVIGSLVQMNAPTIDNQASLVYNATGTYDPIVYTDVNLGNNPATAPLTQLNQFMLDLANFDPVTTTDPVGYWTSRLDLDGFLRNMAMEYLGGAWDNYWMSGSNYFMYFNPKLGTSGKWQWIPTDFDGTFGDGFPVAFLYSYQTLNNFTTIDHPLVSKLIIKNAAIKALFEQTLSDIVGWAYKPEALVPRIELYNKMLAEDVKWDTTIKRTGPGKVNNYTFDDFNTNLYNMTKDMSYSLVGWITDMNKLVVTQLGVTVQPGVADRVAPPPKPSNGNGKKNGGSAKSAASSNLVYSTGLVLVAVFAVAMSSLI